MAKKSKIKKTKKRKQREPLVTVEQQTHPDIQFSKEFQTEDQSVRVLGHRVVDLLCDTGRHDWLADSLGLDLAALSEDVIRNYVTDLVEQARAQGKEVDRGRGRNREQG